MEMVTQLHGLRFVPSDLRVPFLCAGTVAETYAAKDSSGPVFRLDSQDSLLKTLSFFQGVIIVKEVQLKTGIRFLSDIVDRKKDPAYLQLRTYDPSEESDRRWNDLLGVVGEGSKADSASGMSRYLSAIHVIAVEAGIIVTAYFIPDI